MLQAPREFRIEYPHLVDHIAEHVVAVVTEVDLQPLEKLPVQNEIPSAFQVRQNAGSQMERQKTYIREAKGRHY
jgi:hypothetical protein